MRSVQIAGDLVTESRAESVIGSHASRRTDVRVSLDLAGVSVPLSPKDRGLLWVAAGLFGYEGSIRTKRNRGVEPVEVIVSEQSKLNASSLEKSISDILRFTLDINPPVAVREVQSDPIVADIPDQRVEFDTVTLFSGGTDSLCGFLETKARGWSQVGVSVSHSGGTASNVARLGSSILADAAVPLMTLGVNTDGGWRLQQLRGLLYTIAAGVVASRMDSRRIVVSESGPTMILPRIGPLDDVTLTTHPILLQLALNLLKVQYGEPFTIVEPYALLTKAESIASCRAPEAIPSTHSCGNTRFTSRQDLITHCGVCFGCVVRRLSCAVAGVNDAGYASDPLTQSAKHLGVGFRKNQRVSEKKMAEIIDLLIFARQVLEDKLPTSTRRHLEAYHGVGLFRRFALDIFTGLFVLGGSVGLHNGWVSRLYDECLREKVFTGDMAKTRIAEVQERRFRPDFALTLS